MSTRLRATSTCPAALAWPSAERPLESRLTSEPFSKRIATIFAWPCPDAYSSGAWWTECGFSGSAPLSSSMRSIRSLSEKFASQRGVAPLSLATWSRARRDSRVFTKEGKTEDEAGR